MGCFSCYCFDHIDKLKSSFSSFSGMILCRAMKTVYGILFTRLSCSGGKELLRCRLDRHRLFIYLVLLLTVLRKSGRHG